MVKRGVCLKLVKRCKHEETHIFSHRLKIFTLFGFDVSIDASWLFLAALVAWTLADSVFPGIKSGYSVATYWQMSVATTLLFFFSIVFHEMSHSLVARRFGMSIRGITLFIFGGVAEMAQEPTAPKSELLMAAAGPAASVVLSVFFGVLATLVSKNSEPLAIALSWLSQINLILALFNLIPAFPLDGGRVLRAVLWLWRGDLTWATRMASASGEAFGLGLIVLGVYLGATGDIIGGLWYILIGMFLRGAADTTYRETLAKRTLAGLTVSNLMTRDPIAVPPETTIAQFVDNYVYKRHHRSFPVAANGVLMGTIGTEEATAIQRDAWIATTVARAQRTSVPDDIVSPETDVLEALTQMQRTGRSRLWVVKHGLLMGVLSLRDVADYLTARAELGEREGPQASRR